MQNDEQRRRDRADRPFHDGNRIIASHSFTGSIDKRGGVQDRLVGRLKRNQRGSTSIRQLVNSKTSWWWTPSRANFSPVPNSLLTGKRRSPTWGDRGPTVREAEPMLAALWL